METASLGRGVSRIKNGMVMLDYQSKVGFRIPRKANRVLYNDSPQKVLLKQHPSFLNIHYCITSVHVKLDYSPISVKPSCSEFPSTGSVPSLRVSRAQN